MRSHHFCQLQHQNRRQLGAQRVAPQAGHAVGHPASDFQRACLVGNFYEWVVGVDFSQRLAKFIKKMVVQALVDDHHVRRIELAKTHALRRAGRKVHPHSQFPGDGHDFHAQALIIGNH